MPIAACPLARNRAPARQGRGAVRRSIATRQRNAAIAREEGDYMSEQFMHWFIKEQVEEVATMSDLLRVVQRSQDDPMEIEQYIAREHPAATADDPTAPHPAGAG